MKMRRSNAMSDFEVGGLGRAFVHREGPKSLSILAVTAPAKLADLGQFPDQQDTAESIEIRNILSSLDLSEVTIQDDVRITPTYMEFKDASEGMTFRQSMTIRNIGKMPAFVRICEPNSIALRIKSLKKGVMLSPGLALTRWVTYSFKRPALLHATIPIEINGRILDYHIVCSLSTEYIAIEPSSVDFGIVDIGCSSGVKIITISNIGGKSTRFTVDLGKNDMEINVKPYRGIVRPHSKVQLHVEMIGITEGTFYSEFWIKSSPNIRVPIKVNIIIPRLVIYYPNSTGDFTLVDFPPTFVKTRRYDSLVLRNMSSRFSSYVVLGEIDGELVPIKDVDPVEHPAYGVFKINPIEGRLEPFEGTIFHIEFSPTAEAKCKFTDRNNRGNQDFIAFVRILRVHCTEIEDIVRAEAKTEPSADFPPPQKIQIQEDAKSNSTAAETSLTSSEQTTVEVVRLCIHGETEMARLRFMPNEIYLENFETGGSEKRVIRIENPSKGTSVKLRFMTNGNARCEPSESFIEPGKDIEVLVTIGAKTNGLVEKEVKLRFDAIVKSHSSGASRKLMDVKIATFYVICYVNCKDQKTTKPTEKLIPDRSSTDPDFTKTFTEEEISRKKNHRKYWSDYLRTLSNRKSKILESEKLREDCECDEELDELILNNLKLPKPEKLPTFHMQHLCQTNKVKISREAKEKTSIPLSPLQIYNVKVSPTMFTFGSVVTKSINFRELLIENKNSFPVTMRLISLSSRNVRFPDGNTMILRPDCLVKKLVEFRADQIGKFNSYIDYVFNDNHSFELTITADVVHKFLTLGARQLVLGSEEYYSSEECYRPLAGHIEVKNKLNARTNFKWDVPASASFKVNPLAGCIRGRRNLYVSISYEPDTLKNQNSEAIIVTEGGAYMTLKLNTFLPFPDVAFLNETLNVGPIPLNVPYTALGILHNAGYYEVIFEVDQKTVGHGWEVYPKRGIIPPRGIATLEVLLRFEVCLNFAIIVGVVIHKGPRLKLKIQGEVSFPMLKLSPRRIEMRRISADASQSHLLSATNIGKSLLTLSFPLENYPEFRVSLSATQQPLELGSGGIIVLPGNTRNFYLHFKPIDLASYAFYLPVIVNEILGPAVMENPKSLKPQEYLALNEGWFVGSKNINIMQPPSTLSTIFIDCTVAAHVLSFNKLTFNLDTTTGEMEDILCVVNKATKDTSFTIRIDEIGGKNCPFTIEWVRGVEAEFTEVSIECTLQPGSDTEFRIKFNPDGQHGDFSVEAPIFVKGHLDGGVYNRLRLEGKNPEGCIESDTFEIYFCPVPLKAEAEEKFELSVSHLAKASRIVADIMEPARLVGEFRKDLLTVKFPRGNIVEGYSKRTEIIEVCLTFRSEKPVCFSTKLHFHDMQNSTNFFISVFATADNCLLTIHGYPRSSGDGYKMNKLKLWEPSYPSLESDMSENCSLEKQGSGGNQRRFIDTKPRLSLHSNASQSSWNASKIFNSMKIKPPVFKDPNNVEEDDEELEVTSLLDGSAVSVASPHPTKSHRASRLTYPFFPLYTKEEHVEYEQHMKRTLKAAEEWLYSGPLRYQFYPHLIDGITAVFSNLCTIKMMHSEKRRSHTVSQSFVNVLVAIVGPEVYDFIGEPSSLPEDDTERVGLILKTYEDILHFLIVQGAFLCHVSAHYLLNYVDYITTLDSPKCQWLRSKTSLGDDLSHSDRMSSHLFEARSKQCWLDVILQTFKCLVLNRVTAEGLKDQFCGDAVVKTIDISNSISTLSLLNPLTEAVISNIEDRARANQSHSHQESFLLAWLEHNFEQQRQEEWATSETSVLNPLEGKDELQERTISDFENDLSDSLALIAVTITYCPFLVDEFFRNVYSRPRSTEEVLHNAICVVEAWRKIRLGFIVTPQEIVRPNGVQMLMLVVHLFETLPTYLPRTKVRFSCSLTETVIRSLNFSNPNDFSVNYVLQFFGNDSGFFTAVKPEKVLKLNARDNGNVKIEFHARKIYRTRAYLLLSGSAIGPNFARNQCFILEGAASHLGIVNEYNIKSKLYRVVDKTLNIRVPYKYATEYEIWMTEEMPTKPATIKMEKWSVLRLRKVPRRLFLNQTSITVLEGSDETNLSITVGCIVPNSRSFWLVFQAKLGDFIIQINSSSQLSVTDHITVDWARDNCICTDPSSNVISACPLNLSVKIPARNAQLWNCVSHMFQKTLNAKEKQFWARHLDTNIGLRLIHWLMGDHTDLAAQEFQHLFESSVTYTVSISDKQSRLVTMEKFTIPDVKPSNDLIEMKIHVDELTPEVYETTLSLVSLDGRENRIYNVNFLCKDPPRSRRASQYH